MVIDYYFIFKMFLKFPYSFFFDPELIEVC
jgi:hypothetical protein